ncbi:MAG: hypothetical protein HWN67_13990 [Candidatus Helarchaeota archaeon]|nr:hypothetical protein [Candidatus Helarchaeota archaeon]
MDKEKKIPSLSIEELAKSQILNSEYEIFKNLEQKMKILERKINDLTSNQLRIENRLNQFDEKTKNLENQLIKFNNLTNETKDNSDIENEQQFEPEFRKASDLIQINNNNNPEESIIQTKINLCNQLLNYLEKQLESKNITEKEYEVNRHKIKLKIGQLKKKINKTND